MSVLMLKLLIGGAVIAAAVAAVAAWNHRIDQQGYERGRTEVIAKWNEANAKAVAQQRAEQQRLQTQKEKALNEAADREKSLRADVARVGRERDRLRDELAASRSTIDTASVASLRKRASALTDVFQQCVDEYRSVAEKADRHATDSLMYQRAWPAP